MKKYLKKHKSILLSALFFILLQTSISTILQFQKGTMINRAVNKDIEGLLFSTIILFVLIILEIGFTYSSERLNNLFSFKVTMDLKGKLFRSINSKSIEECRDKDTGHYVSLFNNDLNAIRMDFYESITYIFFLVSRIVFVFIALTFIDFKIAIVALVTCMVPLAIPNIMKDRISRTKAKEFEELSRFTEYISDRFNGHRVIKIFGVEEYAAEEFSKVNKGTQTEVYKSSNLTSLYKNSLIFYKWEMNCKIFYHYYINNII